MRLAGAVLSTALVMGACMLTLVGTGSADSREGKGKERARVITDGRLRPGHLETIRTVGFPGKGVTQVSFFPTAICEDECGARNYRGGRTDAQGAGRFRVRVPGTFIDQRHRSAYFRDGERVDVEVTWEGHNHRFDAASAEPEPIIVRAHGSRHG